MREPEEPETVTPRKARQDPAAIFAAPEDVLAHPSLSQQEKIEILRRWAYDIAEEDVALEEGMPGTESGLAQRIVLALSRLTGGLDVERVGPSKQHGLPAARNTRS